MADYIFNAKFPCDIINYVGTGSEIGANVCLIFYFFMLDPRAMFRWK